MRTVPPALSLDLDGLELQGEGALNVLVLSPANDVRDDIACGELCGHVPSDELDLVLVSLDHSPDQRLTVWRTHGSHQLPAKIGIVSAGDAARSTTTRLEANEVSRVPIVTVDDPSDLTELGVRTSDFLSDWAEDGNHLAVCFHSLSTLLDAVDTERVFRFLQVLKGRLDGTNAVAHYHLDPGTHDAETVNTIRATMDVVVEATDDGWQITES